MSTRSRGPGRPWPAGVNLRASGHHLPPSLGFGGPESILSHIRHAILKGDLEPGAWLRQTDLAEHFRVSRTPIREALRALEREGLVRIVPNHGTRVESLSLDDFEEIYALRAGIEGLAARKAAEAATTDDHARLVERLEVLGDMALEGPLLPYLRAEWSLRLACYGLAGRERLIETILHLRGLAERYLRFAYQVEDDMRDSYLFHQHLVQAIARGDGDAAEHTNREALQWTLRRAWPFIKEKIECEPSGDM